MKPREFDELVKQKFDEGGFEYKAQNWDMLAEELDGRAKKRGLLAWLMPLVSMAASVALAMGVPSVLRESSGQLNKGHVKYAQVLHNAPAVPAPKVGTPATIVAGTIHTINKSRLINIEKTHKAAASLKETENTVAQEVVVNTTLRSNIIETFASKNEGTQKKKKLTISTKGYYTFLQEDAPKKVPKISIILSGGMNFGNQTSGYIVSATARRMINDKVYVEGDIAFIGSSNTQNILYAEKNTAATPESINNTTGLGAKNTKTSKYSSDKTVTTPEVPQETIKSGTKAYNLYYAQVTPSIGIKLMKRMSIGAGPDFQQVLVDNRPERSTVDRGNIKENPMFDIGFMGKTEYALTNNIKAAVYYREGINNVITPTNKYIDRNYIQFQIKCTIFNK